MGPHGSAAPGVEGSGCSRGLTWDERPRGWRARRMRQLARRWLALAVRLAIGLGRGRWAAQLLQGWRAAGLGCCGLLG
jgi:hypothetical protein